MGGGGACTAHVTIRPNQIARVMVGATLAVALVDSCGIWLLLRSPCRLYVTETRKEKLLVDAADSHRRR
jgi:hypothetical protein